MLWDNNYFKAVTNPDKHQSLLAYTQYTQARRQQQEQLVIPKQSIVEDWHHLLNWADEGKYYRKVNGLTGQRGPMDLIKKGYLISPFLLGWDLDGYLLAHTYSFNSSMAFFGQQTGTEQAFVDRCRLFTGANGNPVVAQKIDIWCGSFNSQRNVRFRNQVFALPAYYFKILKYRDIINAKDVVECYWLPNRPDETKNLLACRMITYQQLADYLNYDPMTVIRPLP